jgi:hypothetical protein
LLDRRSASSYAEECAELRFLDGEDPDLTETSSEVATEADAPLDLRQRVAGQRGSVTGWPWPLCVRGLLLLLTLAGAVGLRLFSLVTRCAPQRSYRSAPVLVVDPNTAPSGVLEALPHVGPALVRRIIKEREVSPFESIADLRRRVRGLGPATIALLSAHLRIESNGKEVQEPMTTMERSALGAERLAQGPRLPTSR